jgi:hypothetical protein
MNGLKQRNSYAHRAVDQWNQLQDKPLSQSEAWYLQAKPEETGTPATRRTRQLEQEADHAVDERSVYAPRGNTLYELPSRGGQSYF